ncbi:tryptophan-rich sensory protein [Candidatus Roizmanbacteria bacterium]|nr:tryptophan-rich sensory protein [Candidatus Roizmanbacteria bacterium]
MSDAYSWYRKLKKPFFAPPRWIFAPVWTVLYAIIALSFGYTFLLFFQGKVEFIVILPFILNLLSNAIFAPIQFKLRNNYLAALDILVVLFTLIWAMKAVYLYAPWVTYAQIPYVAWVSFATFLQLTVTWINRKRK